jgi:predicted esterase
MGSNMKLFYFIISMLFSTQVFGGYKIDCGPLSVEWARACIHTPESGNNQNVLIHMHGLGINEHGFATYYMPEIVPYFEKNNLDLPIVISFSFGPIWFLAEKNSSSESGLYEVFMQQVLPELEQKVGGFKGHVDLMGESMGGVNVIQLGLRPGPFRKVISIAAPIADLSPLSTEEEKNQFVTSSVGWQFYKDTDPEKVTQAVYLLFEISANLFPTEEEWNQADPLRIASKSNDVLNRRFYITTTKDDYFLNFEGNEKLSGVLKDRGVDITWVPIETGGHVSPDSKSLLKFLAE